LDFNIGHDTSVCLNNNLGNKSVPCPCKACTNKLSKDLSQNIVGYTQERWEGYFTKA